MRRGIVLAAFLLFAPITPAAGAEGEPAHVAVDSTRGFAPELDAYVASTLRAWELPGAAVAVVRDGKVVVARGYGVRRLGTRDSVDANTVFDAASLTKAFTAAAIGTLVDEGKMAWDDPVRRHLPTLEFPDPYLTANVTLRDLLCHRVGIRPTNTAWYLTAVTRPQLLTLVRHMEPAGPFRTRFSYWNIGYTIAGEAAAAAAGTTWEDLVTRRLLEPIGMSRSTVDVDAVPGLGNVASGHAVFDGVQRVTPREMTRKSTAPAGALHSTAADLARWMLFQLGDGTADGRRVLSAATLAETHNAQFTVSSSATFRASRGIRYFPAYGLGWQVFDYHGHPMLWHSGNGDGQLAYLALLPEEKLGVVVLVNTSKGSSPLTGALAGHILDHYLGEPARDDTAAVRRRWVEQETAAADVEKTWAKARLRNARPSRSLADYAGSYDDRLGLEVRVRLEADTLRLTYGGGEPATLVPWHHDVFRAIWQNPFHAKIMPTFVSFDLDEEGQVARLHMAPNRDEVDAPRRR